MSEATGDAGLNGCVTCGWPGGAANLGCKAGYPAGLDALESAVSQGRRRRDWSPLL